MSEENNTEMFAERSSNVANSTKKVSEDALGLGPKQAGRFMIGFVDRIAGEGGLEVPGFVATKDETLQLVRYWATEIIHYPSRFRILLIWLHRIIRMAHTLWFRKSVLFRNLQPPRPTEHDHAFALLQGNACERASQTRTTVRSLLVSGCSPIYFLAICTSSFL